MNRFAAGAAAAVVLALSGCSIGEPAVRGPLDDALGVPTAELLHAQIVEGWSGMVSAADQNCVTEMTGATLDPAAFTTAEATYEKGLTGLKASGRPVPAGYPTDITIDLTNWCAVAQTLKESHR